MQLRPLAHHSHETDPKTLKNYIHVIFFFYLDFLSGSFTMHRTVQERGCYFFNSSLPLPPASQTLGHQPGDYSRELKSAHSQQSDSNREPFASQGKSLTTQLRAPIQCLLKNLNLKNEKTDGFPAGILLQPEKWHVWYIRNYSGLTTLKQLSTMFENRFYGINYLNILYRLQNF